MRKYLTRRQAAGAHPLLRTVGLFFGVTLTFVLVASCGTTHDFSPATAGSSGGPSSAGTAGTVGTAGSLAQGGAQGAAAGANAVAGSGGVGGAAVLGAGGLAGADTDAGGVAAIGAGGGDIQEGGAAGSPSVAHPNGIGCSGNAECDSGFCVEHVCCDTSCGAACSSCRAVSTGMAEGVCGFVTSGMDPDNDCADSTDACGHDGTCNGAGGCRFKGVNLPCGNIESCTNGEYAAAGHCDGGGNCVQPPPISCGSSACKGTVCALKCSPPTVECPTGLWCDGGTCKAKKANGTMCSDNGECSSSACAEGVCCDNACTGTCRSCKAANTGTTEGHCAPITAGTDPDNECVQAAVSTCGNDGYCDGSSACRQYPNGTECRVASCADGANTSTASAQVKCSGGACANAATSSCGTFKCGGSTCRGSCTQTSDCAKGNYCDSPKCVATKDTGSLCKASAECTTNICNSFVTNKSFGHCCTTPTCNCPGPTFVNLLKNPGFDKDIADWDVYKNGGTYRWYQFEERDSCSLSGQFARDATQDAGYQLHLRQCAPVQQNTDYNFGGSWKSSTLFGDPPNGEQWNASCVIAFYSTLALCQDHDNEYQNRFDGWTTIELDTQTPAAYHWYDFTQKFTAPAAAQAAVIDCMVTDDYAPTTTVYFDKFFISPYPATY